MIYLVFSTVTDSGSNTNEVSTIIRKRIIAPSSDSDSEIESHEKKHSEVIVTNHSLFNNRINGKMKNPSILEKEKQMKFLLEIFPNLEAMVNIS